ncbi:MAG: hypothetical protein ABIN96_09495 [Rubrivivax sp.]
MKTTIDLAGPILEAARRMAETEGTTLRALMEAGLRQVVADRNRRSRQKPFKLRDASFKGRGLRAEWQDRTWGDLRDTAYEGRGT